MVDIQLRVHFRNEMFFNVEEYQDRIDRWFFFPEGSFDMKASYCMDDFIVELLMWNLISVFIHSYVCQEQKYETVYYIELRHNSNI